MQASEYETNCSFVAAHHGKQQRVAATLERAKAWQRDVFLRDVATGSGGAEDRGEGAEMEALVDARLLREAASVVDALAQGCEALALPWGFASRYSSKATAEAPKQSPSKQKLVRVRVQLIGHL